LEQVVAIVARSSRHNPFTAVEPVNCSGGNGSVENAAA
jgi:hypothetical protein